ncbi:aminoglycoside 3'-phosphotransferase [Sphingomonas sp. LR60]|uniref:APH(3') family aminoglycoside O-phosphotransferase n=1 Tax=Sphingomonas sp. LR60 TaxID=3050233 RepID=UPI002FE1E30E
MPIPLPPSWRERLAGATWEREPEGESGGVIHRILAANGDRLFLKYGDGAVAEAVADEAIRLRWLQGRVVTVRLVATAFEPDATWLLTSAASGKTGDAWIDESPDSLTQVIRGFATFLRTLHALPVDECPFDASASVRLAAARKLVAAGKVDEADFGHDHLGMSAAAVLAEAERLACHAAGRVVTHGDFSLGNVLLDADGVVTGCIDVGRLGVADPYQDIAILWENLGEFGDAAQHTLLASLGLDALDEDRLLFHRTLDELF